MSGTPRTYAEIHSKDPCFSRNVVTVDANFACQLEMELNAANERIRRLDGRCQALDDQVCNLLEICRQHGVDVSSQDMINGRRKAKEAKP